jgi:hypothetical protein
MKDMGEDIPGLAQYLPARPRKRQPGYCRNCGVKIDEYDEELAKQGYWQPSYCQTCLGDDDEGDD